MRRIAAVLLVLCLANSLGCQTVSNFFRDAIFGGLAEKYDSSRPPSERRTAYDDYVRENTGR